MGGVPMGGGPMGGRPMGGGPMGGPGAGAAVVSYSSYSQAAPTPTGGLIGGA
jgi:hypothetical protein